MESLVKQRRVTFSEQHGSNRTAPRRALSFDGEDKEKRSWFQRQEDYYEYDPKEMEYSAAVAAAAFAISSIEEAETDFGRKIKVESQRSMGRANSMKEDPITRLGSFRSLSIKEERDLGESSSQRPSSQDRRVQQQESGFHAKRPSLSSSMRPEEGKQYQRNYSMRRDVDVSGPDSWEKAQLRKISKRYEKMKSKIVAWEEAKKMKAKLHMERKKNELEMRRTSNMQHYQSKLVRIDMIANGFKAQLDDKRRKEEAEVKDKARHGGGSTHSCFWWN